MARVIAGASEPGNNRLMDVAALALAVLAAALVYAALEDGGAGGLGAGDVWSRAVCVVAPGAWGGPAAAGPGWRGGQRRERSPWR